MDKNLINYLDNLGIKYKIHFHPPVFTVDQAKKIDYLMPEVFHTKNLFLKDKSGKFFLVCMNADKKADLKKLKNSLNAKKKLYFASSEELKENLNLAPGSVSIFSMIYAKQVFLIIDREVWQADRVGFHPNINTATLEISHNDLEKFYNSLKAEKIILPIN